ncbi:MAG: hypothetical protein Q7R80_00435 [bacterium]|nr:hypothetical protein [bacterium]
MIPSSQQPSSLPQRRFGVTELVLVLIVVVGGIVIVRQQRQIAELRTPGAAPATSVPTNAAPATPTSAVPVTWEIENLSTGENCDAGIREQLVVRSNGATEVIIPSLQEAAQTPMPHFFEIGQQSADVVTLRSVPCGVGLSVEGSEPIYDYWDVRRNDRVLETAGYLVR